MFLDVHEPDFLKDAFQDIATVARLETGDIVWVGSHGATFAIERKTANDLVSSVLDGRLTDQLRRLISNFTVPVLMIENFVRSLGDNRVNVPKKEGGMSPIDLRYTALELMKLEAQMAGVYIMQTTSEQGTVNMIRSLHKWSQEDNHDWINSRSRSGELRLHRSRQVHFIMGLPSVGEKTAQDLLKYFGSPIAIVEAFYKNPSMIKSVPGISDNRIRAIRDVILPNEND